MGNKRSRNSIIKREEVIEVDSEVYEDGSKCEDRAVQLISEIDDVVSNISRKLKMILNDKVPNAGDNQSEDCELNRMLADTLYELQTLHTTIAL